MKTIVHLLAPAVLIFLMNPFGQTREPVLRARTAINLPNPPGLVTLKCDLHIHTVFSDGQVWPAVRVEEAWREGLDAIAITDHVEYHPHTNDVVTNVNRSFDLAKKAGADLDLIVIKGAEISRKMPPGHLNALFITNATPLTVTNPLQAVAAAHLQGAFLMWNHPGWEAQITNDLVLWYPEHTALLQQGMLHAIEAVNGRDYYPEGHRWASEKKLALIANTDAHGPIGFDYLLREGDHRPMTLVFAEERSPEAIKKALFARHTAIYSANRLIGAEQFLRPIYEKSIRLKNPKLEIKGKQRVNVQITNDSDVDYELERVKELEEVAAPKKLILAGRKTVILEVRGKANPTKGRKNLKLPFLVKNVLIGPDQPLPVTIDLTINFTPVLEKKTTK